MATNKELLINVDNRIIYFSNDVDNWSVSQACFNIDCWNAYDDADEKKLANPTRQPIHLYINTKGGDVYDMWALVDVIEKSKTPVYTYCNGYAMSAGFLIYLAGHKRFASRHANFMYHQIYMRRSDKYQDLVDNREQDDYLQDELEKYVMERTKITKESIEKLRNTKTDMYIHLDEAIDLGIVTDRL